MNKNRYALAVVCAIVLFSLVSCASKGGEEAFEPAGPEKEMFLDWQYRGFGAEYPLWCESALKKDIKALARVFPELEGKEDETVLVCAEGSDADMCMRLAQDDEALILDFNLVAQSWVEVEMQDGTTKYICIKVGFIANQQEETL